MKSAFKAKLLASAVAALFAAVSYSVMADDPVKAGNKTVADQGRAIDDKDVVKKGNKTVDAQGRAIDDKDVVKKGNKKVDAQGRAIEE